jgi:hypothetical protein
MTRHRPGVGPDRAVARSRSGFLDPLWEIRSTRMAGEAYHRSWRTGRRRSAERPEATFAHTF